MSKAEKVRAEIERLKEETGIGLSEYDMGEENGKYEICVKLLSFIDSLPEEPVSEDLKEAAIMHYKDIMGRKIITGLETANITSFKAGAKWQKEQMMKKPNLSGYVARDEDGDLHIFEVEPRRLEEKHRWWDRDYDCHIIDNDAFPDLRWKDEPICVKLIIIKEN